MPVQWLFTAWRQIHIFALFSDAARFDKVPVLESESLNLLSFGTVGTHGILLPTSQAAFQPSTQLIGPGVVAHDCFDQLQLEENVTLCGSWQAFNHPVEAVCTCCDYCAVNHYELHHDLPAGITARGICSTSESTSQLSCSSIMMPAFMVLFAAVVNCLLLLAYC